MGEHVDRSALGVPNIPSTRGPAEVEGRTASELALDAQAETAERARTAIAPRCGAQNGLRIVMDQHGNQCGSVAAMPSIGLIGVARHFRDRSPGGSPCEWYLPKRALGKWFPP